MADSPKPSKLFSNVHYAISDALDDNKRKQLSVLLSANGGQSVTPNDPKLTHFITAVLPHTESQSLDGLPSDTQAHLVTPLWVERTVVLNSTQDPAGYSPDPAFLFSGITATATDLAPSDLEVLSAGVTALGGQWRSGLTKEVTHLFALSKGSAKYETAIKFQKTINIKVLVPHWFDDSVRLGYRGLPTGPYEWPTPTVFKVGWEGLQNEERRSTPATMSPEKKALYETLLTSPGQDPEISKATPRNIWKEKKLLLAEELGLTESQRQAHETDIEREGGVVVRGEENVEEADIIVTRYRAGPTYVKAFRLKKMIGSLSWLWYVRSTGKISRPTDQLLHYPIPKRTVEGFSNHSITITNYTGKDREYLKKLIATLGGNFTPSMSGKNTVVIAACHQGTKTEKAVAWGIPVVNHLWLEDCFINWRNLTTTNDKYTCFPPGVDFGSMLGEKGIGRVGYDLKELETLEKDVVREEKVLESGETSPKKTPAKKGKGKEVEGLARSASMKEVEDVVFGGDDEDVVMNGVGEVSVEGALEVELDQDIQMDIDDDDPFVSSKGKGKARPPSKADDGRVVSRSDKKRRVERSRSSERDAAAVPTKPPQTPSIRSKMKTKAQSSATPGRKDQLEDDDDDEVMEVANQSPLQPTPKRGRGRPRKSAPANEGNAEPAESPVKRGRGRPRKSVSRPRVASQSQGEQGDAPPKRGRGRPRKSESQPRPAEPSDEEAEEEAEASERPRRGPGRPRKVPYDGPSPSPRRTRSQSRARAGKGNVLPPLGVGEDDSDVQVISGPSKTPSKAAKGKAVETDSEYEVVQTTSAKKRGRPSTTAATTSGAKERRRQVIDDSDSDSDVPWKPKSKPQRTESRGKKAPPIEIDTDSDDERAKKSPTTPSKTLKRRLSVVVPTRGQVYSQSQENLRSPKRGGKSPQRGRTIGASASKTRYQSPPESVTPSHSPSPSPKHKTLKSKPVSNRPRTPSPGPSTSTHRRRPSGVGVDETPAQRSPSRRSAATKATKKLHDEVMPDMNQFQKQLKRGVMKGSWEEKAEKTEKISVKGKKRASMGEREDSVEENEREKKRAKKDEKSVVPPSGGKLNKKDPSTIVIMTTQVTFTDDIKRSMTRLGVSFTTNPAECTHLVAKNLVRTEKFLCAIANAPIVVTDKWIETCASTHHLLSEDGFLLVDPANEKKWGVNLNRSLERARENNGKLFDGMTFYLTPKLPVGTKLLKNVITAGGGKVGTGTPTVRILKASSDRYVISCPDDKTIWRPLAEAGYPVYNQELILTGMLKQEIDWENAGHQVSAT